MSRPLPCPRGCVSQASGLCMSIWHHGTPCVVEFSYTLSNSFERSTKFGSQSLYLQLDIEFRIFQANISIHWVHRWPCQAHQDTPFHINLHGFTCLIVDSTDVHENPRRHD
ncbi:unnamed protein product [Protopolystoma xenopodis]|uniref:Uncharacterized protein n=1 Tax=Protopolystoma xenopodis TaxID=117903 RepID=A0A448XM86_9PLAT|nr:unnamed protein product [Protopolystoma xenopodis]